MLPSERLELAVYQAIKRGPAQGFDTSLPVLSQITGEMDHHAIAERLKDLESNNRVTLSKYSGGQRWPRGDSPDRTFFHTGSFLVEVAPRGRKYFEKLEQRAEHEANIDAAPPAKPLVFISCGQSTPAERELGQEIARLVENVTGCQAYFAENQNALEGVTENILKKLHAAAGFIAIMHPRGNVSNPNDTSGQFWVRGSVWVEQEIAIAAFISQALGQPMRVRAYVHEGIFREGLRDKVLLNPKVFQDDSEILADLTTELASWRNLTQPRKGEFDAGHRNLAKEKLSRLSQVGKSVVIYLLHHGKTEATELMRECRLEDQSNDAIQQARGLGLLRDSATRNPARPGTLYFWEVNPSFEAVLRDLLGKG